MQLERTPAQARGSVQSWKPSLMDLSCATLTEFALLCNRLCGLQLSQLSQSPPSELINSGACCLNLPQWDCNNANAQLWRLGDAPMVMPSWSDTNFQTATANPRKCVYIKSGSGGNNGGG